PRHGAAAAVTPARDGDFDMRCRWLSRCEATPSPRTPAKRSAKSGFPRASSRPTFNISLRRRSTFIGLPSQLGPYLVGKGEVVLGFAPVSVFLLNRALSRYRLGRSGNAVRLGNYGLEAGGILFLPELLDGVLVHR